MGTLEIVSSERGLRAILCDADLEDDDCQRYLSPIPVATNEHTVRASAQLREYFTRGRIEFDVNLDIVGTKFQQRAWHALSKIPYGETISYSQQAKRLGSAALARAVGGANRCNPISIIVPCHRVIGKSGDLTGFAGGLGMKEYLLRLERP